ncbi:MAG: SDR family oxidoreductase [bacterium]|nr:SDR family oxidoreductase [bacterium]
MSSKTVGLKDKVVLITGSSIGIGAALAEEFARQGAKVVITYNTNKDAAMRLAEKCLTLGAADILVLKLDVRNEKEILESVARVKKEFGHIDVLVNNAGVFAEGTVETTTFEGIEDQVRVNLEGLIKMTHAALPYLKGAVVNIGSRAGTKPYPNYATYAATKWAVRGFSKSLAAEIALPVYCVNPAGTATAMNDFEGVPASKVAEVILAVLTGKIKAESGDDINVWEY